MTAPRAARLLDWSILLCLAAAAVIDFSGGFDAGVEGMRLRARSPDRPFTLALGLLIFYAFCLQCAATIAMIRRETNSWGWAGFAWVYMTGMGYLGALLAYQLGT